jgi:hypothetical protein
MQPFTKHIYESLVAGDKLDKRKAESIAAGYGIDDKNTIKEMCELAVVYRARQLAHAEHPNSRYIFNNIVQLYRSQTNLSHRTSQSVMLQQYSTPAPIALLAGLFVRNLETRNRLYFEPSAGNGLLTIALPVECVYVNEIDEIRSGNLAEQGFKQQLRQDATQPFALQKKFDGIVTNPPFGKVYEPLTVDGFKINVLDHMMAIRALDCMKDSGRAAIIIGGHTEWDSAGRIQAGKNRVFFAYLYKHYNVKDVINVDGALYSRQGTSFNIRLILIDGRKDKPGGYPPLKRDTDKVVRDFDTLFDKVDSMLVRCDSMVIRCKAKALKMKLKLLKMEGLGGGDIPIGTTKEDVKAREQIIYDFYAQWNAEHPEKMVYNKDLKDNILIRFLSIQETARHAALRYESTIAVVRHFNDILAKAKRVGKPINPKPNSKNQKQFDKLLEMHYTCDSGAIAKLTVGVCKSDNRKIQYCITSIKNDGGNDPGVRQIVKNCHRSGRKSNSNFNNHKTKIK